ncbi:hypothetical protein ALC56_09897 [Trachymyrmex septentrionalis]|uniref:Uncharacterized protein n=1 Tax=Trachymyrmex septentrionalis TaxID=34720 RepID=A0A151JU26_9HYME|nr:hypothetical protein ALC56_09897 [Trachymyrmex septentrionalis]
MPAIYHKLELARSPWPTSIRIGQVGGYNYKYAHAKIPDRNFAIALRGTRRKLMEMDVIPADRRPPEKEETWTLAADQQDSCVCFDGAVVDSKVKDGHSSEKTQLKPLAEVISVDAGDNVDNTLPRSQETRKSKTKKVKSYLKKCKGALSKGDESVSADKRRQENCTSWYLDDVSTCASQQEDHDEPPEKYTEFLEERLEEAVRDVESVEDPVPETLEENFLRGENFEETPHDALTRLLEEDRRTDLSGTSLYEDAKDANPERPVSDEKTPTKELELFRDEEQKDAAISLETLTTEDTNLNKCDSSDTLIAEVPEATEIATDLNSELTIIVKEEEGDAPKDPADEEIIVPACCGRSLEAVYSGAPLEHPVYLCSITFTSDYRLNRTSSVDAQKTISGEYGAGFIVIGGNDGFTPSPPPPPPTTTILFS